MDWNVTRWMRHELHGRRALRRALPKAALQRLTQATAASEKRHSGQVRLALEAALELPRLWRGVTARERALEVFSQLRIWDTEANNGVLLYLLFADRQVEIVADRGVHRVVGAAVWREICGRMQAAFRQGRFEAGLAQGIAEVTEQLERHFPHADGGRNELPDAPVIL